MKTKKNFSELFGLSVAASQIIGIVALIISTSINLFVYKGESQILDLISIIGWIAFILPFFVAEFALPSGLLDRFGVQTDIPFWGKFVFYVILFPVINMWLLSGVDALFHILPDFHAAMAQGASMTTVRALREQWQNQGWMIVGITYFVMIGSGLLFRIIFGRKLKAKIA